MATTVLQDPIAPTEQERLTLTALTGLLAAGQTTGAQLVGPNGTVIPLPASAYRVLTQVIVAMAEGHPVTVLPLHRELTTQEAADLLNVSRQYLVRLLDAGKLPSHRVGTHRRVRFGDLMAYRARRMAERREALDELTRLSEDLGMYDDDFARDVQALDEA